jgi:hypothetical protein
MIRQLLLPELVRAISWGMALDCDAAKAPSPDNTPLTQLRCSLLKDISINKHERNGQDMLQSSLEAAAGKVKGSVSWIISFRN